MRSLFTLAFILAIGWASWWFIGGSAQKTAVDVWLRQQRDAGWVASVESHDLTGFPSRFDNVFKNLTLGDPRAGWQWEASRFELLALSYKPNHIIAVWPNEHRLETRNGAVTITSEQFRGSLLFKPDTALSLDRMQLETSDLQLSGDNGWRVSSSKSSVAFFAHNAPDMPKNSYDLYIDIGVLVLPEDWTKETLSTERPSKMVDEILFDATLTFDRPWNRFFVETSDVHLTQASIHDISVNWGDTQLSGAGSIDVAVDGYISGTLELQVQNWQEILDAMTELNIFDRDFSNALRRGITFVATLAGNPTEIEIPLRFKNNLTYIGLVPIGPAPRIY